MLLQAYNTCSSFTLVTPILQISIPLNVFNCVRWMFSYYKLQYIWIVTDANAAVTRMFDWVLHDDPHRLLRNATTGQDVHKIYLVNYWLSCVVGQIFLCCQSSTPNIWPVVSCVYRAPSSSIRIYIWSTVICFQWCLLSVFVWSVVILNTLVCRFHIYSATSSIICPMLFVTSHDVSQLKHWRSSFTTALTYTIDYWQIGTSHIGCLKSRLLWLITLIVVSHELIVVMLSAYLSVIRTELSNVMYVINSVIRYFWHWDDEFLSVVIHLNLDANHKHIEPSHVILPLEHRELDYSL